MFWKAVTLFGLALCAQGERHATSEQIVKQEFGGLHHIGSHVPEHHEEYAWAYPSYEFSYYVNDPHTHDHKGQREHRLGDEVKGEYWLLQPDGKKRTVRYQSDKHKGFKAEVHYSEHEHHEEPRLEEVIKPVVEVVKEEPEKPAEIEPVVVEEIPVAVVEDREEERIEPRHTKPKHYKPIHIEYYVNHKYRKHHEVYTEEEERREAERREKESEEAERREEERREKESKEEERRQEEKLEAARREKERRENEERRETQRREKESEEAERHKEEKLEAARREEERRENEERREAERREMESEEAERRQEEELEAARREEGRRENEERREEERREEEEEQRKPVHIEYFSNIHHPLHNQHHGYEIPRHHYYKHVEVEEHKEHNPIHVHGIRAERKHEPHVQLLRMHKPLLFRPEQAHHPRFHHDHRKQKKAQ